MLSWDQWWVMRLWHSEMLKHDYCTSKALNTSPVHVGTIYKHMIYRLRRVSNAQCQTCKFTLIGIFDIYVWRRPLSFCEVKLYDKQRLFRCRFQFDWMLAGPDIGRICPMLYQFKHNWIDLSLSNWKRCKNLNTQLSSRVRTIAHDSMHEDFPACLLNL